MLTLLQISIFLSYIVYILYTFKKPLPSISDSYYQLDGYKSNLFVAFIWALGITMTQQEPSLLFFFSGVALSFVGAACMFKWTSAGVHIVHYISAVSAILLALVGLGIVNSMWLPLIIWAVFTIIFKLLKITNFLWWVEILAFLLIIIGLLCR